MIIIKYKDKVEESKIIAEQEVKGHKLVEVANITEGNFLGFDTSPLPPEIMKEIDKQAVLLDIQAKLSDMQLKLQKLLSTK